MLAATDADDLADDAARGYANTRCATSAAAASTSDEDVRARLREIAERLTVLDQDFGRAIRDDVRSIRVRPEQLDGLPADFIDAHPADADGLITITTDYPDLIPVRTFAHDAERRAASSSSRSSTAAGHTTTRCCSEMLDLRAEQARLLGYDSWPDYDAEVKMIGTGAAILEFIDKIAGRLGCRGAPRLRGAARTRASSDDPTRNVTRPAPTRPTTTSSCARENFDVDAQEVRHYFDFPRVRAGLLDITARLFGVEYRPRDGRPVWHEDVTATTCWRRRGDRTDLSRPASARGQVQARRAVRPRRRGRRPAAARRRAGLQLPARR